MARPPSCKRVEELPGVGCFKPETTDPHPRTEVLLSVEELEALRLAHRESLYQEAASARMGISRTTFGRVLTSAHRKVTQALLDGCVLRIEGGSFCMIGPGHCKHCPKGAESDGTSHCEHCPLKRK